MFQRELLIKCDSVIRFTDHKRSLCTSRTGHRCAIDRDCYLRPDIGEQFINSNCRISSQILITGREVFIDTCDRRRFLRDRQRALGLADAVIRARYVAPRDLVCVLYRSAYFGDRSGYRDLDAVAARKRNRYRRARRQRRLCSVVYVNALSTSLSATCVIVAAASGVIVTTSPVLSVAVPVAASSAIVTS